MKWILLLTATCGKDSFVKFDQIRSFSSTNVLTPPFVFLKVARLRLTSAEELLLGLDTAATNLRLNKGIELTSASSTGKFGEKSSNIQQT